MLRGCQSVEYRPSVDRVSVGTVLAVLVGCRSVEYAPIVGRVSIGRVLAECQ